MTPEKELDEARDLIERLALAGWRLQKLASGAEVQDGDMVFACKVGLFCEEVAQQRIRWLIRCEAAIKSMAAQIVSPATTPEGMVADILNDQPKRKGRATR